MDDGQSFAVNNDKNIRISGSSKVNKSITGSKPPLTVSTGVQRAKRLHRSADGATSKQLQQHLRLEHCEFHPDAVTAKTISRLSQGVAHLTTADANTSTLIKLHSKKLDASHKAAGNSKASISKSDLSCIDRSKCQNLSFASADQIIPGKKRNYLHVVHSLHDNNLIAEPEPTVVMTTPMVSDGPRRVFSAVTRRKLQTLDLTDTTVTANSSDSSMLSLTPPHSYSASSFAELSSSSDSDRKFRSVKAKSLSLSGDGHLGNRRRSYCREAKTHAPDCWRNWRTSRPIETRNSFRSGGYHHNNLMHHHRPLPPPVQLSSNGDDSSDGPACQLKRARVNFYLRGDRSDQSMVASTLTSSLPLEGHFTQPRRCNCSSGLALIRRTTSHSPVPDYTDRRQRPLKFRLSNLCSASVTKSDNSMEKVSSPSTSARHDSDKDAEGDDECSESSKSSHRDK